MKPPIILPKYPTIFNKVHLPYPVEWHNTLEKYLWTLLDKSPLRFSKWNGKNVTSSSGVYLITDHRNPDQEYSFYVGKASNLQKRVYSHVMGSVNNSPTLRYLISDEVEPEITDRITAITFIKSNLSLRWVECEEEYEDTNKLIGYVEAYIVSKLKPLYGINNEYRANIKKK